MVAALLLIAAPAHAWHGGADAKTVQPAVSVPGDKVTIEIEAGDAPYLANAIHVPAPTVDGETLFLDYEATNETFDAEYWSLDLNASSSEELRFRWQAAKAVNDSILVPSPPAQLEIVLNGSQPGTEGDARWTAQFCVGDWLDGSDALQQTIGGIPVSIGVDSETGVYLCLDGHKPSTVHTFDNEAPEVNVTLSNEMGQTRSPFYRDVTVNVTASDNGTGLDKVAAAGVSNDTGSTVLVDWLEPLAGEQQVPYRVWDNVGNLTKGVVPVTVVDGVAAVTGDTGPFRAGEIVPVLAGYSANVSGSLPAWVPSATGNVSLSQVDGPAGADVEAATPLSDGYRRFNVTATTVGTYTLNVSATQVPVGASVDVPIEPAALDSVAVSPSSATVLTSGVVEFNASGEDAYGNDVDLDGHAKRWTASCGVVNPGGEFVAPPEPGTCTVTFEANPKTGSGIVSDQAEVTVISPDEADDGDGDEGTTPDALAVSNLRSPTHPVDAWSSKTQVEAAWDAPDGDVSGYAFALTLGDGDVGTDPATTKTSITVKAPSDGTYTFKVRPIADDGSAGEVATLGPIRIDTDAPMPPHDAEPAKADDGLELTWSPVPVNSGSPIAEYTIDRKAEGGSWTQVGEVADGTRFVDGSIPSPGKYHYRLRSIDEAGNAGPPSKWITVKLDEIPGSTSEEGIPASMADLYDALGLAPRNASFEDEDGDGVADAIDGDPRISLSRVTTIGGGTAYLVAAEGQDTGALVTATSQAFPVQQHPAEIASEKAGKNGLIATAKAGSLAGWTLVSIPDDHPDLPLDGVFDGDRDRIPEDRYWRLDGAIAVLDNRGGTYMLLYGDGGASGRSTGGQPATPGPTALLAVAGLVGAALWVRRRDP